jgi:nucleoside-diphosphate-sugar epimerase
MSETFIILGATGLIGSAVRTHLEALGARVIPVGSKDYPDRIGAEADVLINCNGNAVRYLARQNPKWDFEASVETVHRSLFDFTYGLYVYVSTVDVYNVLDDPSRNHEDAPIRHDELDVYAFHKWTAERLVERFAGRSVIARVGTAIGSGIKKNPIYDLLNGHPLHMSLKSELSLIDTPTIARCLETIVRTGPKREIVNVSARGSVRLLDVQQKLGRPASLAPGAEDVVYRYHVNTDKMARLMPLPTAWEALTAYLESSATRQR